MKKWYVGIMAVLVVALTTTVFAFGPGGRSGAPCGGPGYGMGPGTGGGPGYGRGPGAGHGMGAGWANLNLSKEQMEKMWQSKEKFRSDTQALRFDLFQRRLEMKKNFTDPSIDEKTLLAKQKELSALKQQMQDKMAQFRIEQRKILTPEQLKKIGEGGFGRGAAGHGMGGRGYGAGGPRAE